MLHLLNKLSGGLLALAFAFQCISSLGYFTQKFIVRLLSFKDCQDNSSISYDDTIWCQIGDLYRLRLYRSACSLFINWMSNVIIGGWPFYVCTLLQKLQNAAWSCVGSWFTQIYQFILKKAYWTYLCCHLPGTGERINGCRILSWRLWRSLAYADEKENYSCWTSCKSKFNGTVLLPALRTR